MPSTQLRATALAALLAVFMLSAALAHNHGHDHGHDHDHHGVVGTRLLVSDANSNAVYVVDLASGQVLGTFTTPGQGSRIYATPNGQYGFAIDRDANRVTVIHSGLSLVDHGDHADLVQETPYVLVTMNVGRQPTHLFAHGHDIAIFNDQDGTIAILDERLLGLTLDFTEIVTAQPDHGAPAIIGDVVLSGHLNLGRVDAYTRDGSLITSFEGCPRLHGKAVLGQVAAFGCSDGVLLVALENGELRASKLDNPRGGPEGARVGMLSAHYESPIMVGNFGAGLALIDPVAQTLTTVALPSLPLAIDFDHHGEHIVVLGRDGFVYVLERDGEIKASLEVVAPFDQNAPRSALAIAEAAFYVSSPATGEVLEVHFHDGKLEVERRLGLPGAPGHLAVLALEGGKVH
jgi:outer membrane protein assembly factor BamB